MILALLYYEFFKIGLFTIGGGLAALPLLYNLAEKYPAWFDSTMVTNMIAISESTPGPIAINMATYAGFQTAGFSGGVIATIGFVTPSLIIVTLIARLLQQFRQSSLVERSFQGIRPAVTGLIAAAGLGVAQIALLNTELYTQTGQWLDLLKGKALLLCLFMVIITMRFKRHPIFYIAVAALAGIIFKM